MLQLAVTARWIFFFFLPLPTAICTARSRDVRDEMSKETISGVAQEVKFHSHAL